MSREVDRGWGEKTPLLVATYPMYDGLDYTSSLRS
jgi:hypothetical protein